MVLWLCSGDLHGGHRMFSELFCFVLRLSGCDAGGPGVLPLCGEMLWSCYECFLECSLFVPELFWCLMRCSGQL